MVVCPSVEVSRADDQLRFGSCRDTFAFVSPIARAALMAVSTGFPAKPEVHREHQRQDP